MKKFLSLVLAIIMLAAVISGCSQNDGEDAKGPEGTPAEIIEKIYEKNPVELPVSTTEIDLTNTDTVKMFTGLENADKIAEAAVSEPMTGSQAYSLVIVRVKNEEDASAVAEEMKENINPRKWICVEADDICVAGCGDVVMFFMVSSELDPTSDGMLDAFKEVCGGTLTIE